MMKKKSIAVFLSVLLVSLCACSAKNETVTDAQTNIMPSLADMEEANAYENLIAVYGAVTYACSYSGEEPTDKKYVDGAGVYHFYTETDSATYATADSYYIYRDGEISAYLDMSAVEFPQDPAWDAYDFYSGDNVESIEKTENGYRVTFAPDAEQAEFFMEEYQEGDVFIVTEDVRDNLTLSHIRQFIRRADGTEITLNETTMEPTELPEIAQQMHDRAVPAEENKAVATIHSQTGDEPETVFTVAFTKGDKVTVETYDFAVYYNAERTEECIPASVDTQNNIELYAYREAY